MPPLAVSFGHGKQADWGSDLPAVSKDEGSQETDNQLLQLREFCEGKATTTETSLRETRPRRRRVCSTRSLGTPPVELSGPKSVRSLE